MNRWKIILPVALIVTVVVLFFLLFPHRSFANDIVIDSDRVDNSYNNSIANAGSYAVKIGDTIYYDYLEDTLDYGTFAIKSGMTKRTYWGGFQLYPDAPFLDNLFQGKILLEPSRDDYFDPETGSCQYFDTAYSPDIKKEFYCFIKDNLRYFISSDNQIYCQQDGTYQLIADITDAQTDLSKDPPYITDRYIYYEDEEKEGFASLLCQYDRKQQKTIKKLSFEKPSETVLPSTLMGNNNQVLFQTTDFSKLYLVDFDKETVETVYDVKEGTLTVNLFENNVYLGVRASDKAGLFTFPLDCPDQIRQLTSENVYGVYILDHQYVYFTDGEDNLYLIKNTGGEVETVFKK